MLCSAQITIDIIKPSQQGLDHVQIAGSSLSGMKSLLAP